MQLTYVIDYVFSQTPDGAVWTDTSYDFEFWKPYIGIYGRVMLLCRVQQVEEQLPAWKEVTGDGLQVTGLPAYHGPLGYLRHAREIRENLREALADTDAVILRMPSNLARLAGKELGRTGRRYAVEVVGDPNEALAPGIVKMPGRAFFRWMFTAEQKSICQGAAGVAYVAEVLRNRYPAAEGVPTLLCSDVRLEGDWLNAHPRQFVPDLHRHLITVATLSQTYKGIDVLLRALSICIERHFDLSLTIVGTGRHRERLERQAVSLGIADHVEFVGALPWGPVLMEELDNHDLFVLPSRVEVLPRALLEAMARGLPVIATSVGAIPEVLEPEEMVTPGDAVQLAHRIIHLQLSARRLHALSVKNIHRAEAFSMRNLMPRWQAYQHELLRTLTSKAPLRWRKVTRPAAA